MSARNKILLLVGLGTVGLLSGCSLLGSDGALDPALATCPQSPIGAEVRIDASGSSSDSAIIEERMNIVGDVAHRAALCGGRLLVSAFSSSSSGTVTLYDADVKVDGATDAAKSRRVDAVVDTIVKEVQSKYETAIASLPTNGSDITAQLRLSSEYAAQLVGYQLDTYILTDGFNNVGVNLEGAMSAQQAIDLADTVAAPDLSGAWLTMAGIGRVDGNTSSSAQTEALVAFYRELCKRTKAATCSIVTNFVERW